MKYIALILSCGVCCAQEIPLPHRPKARIEPFKSAMFASDSMKLEGSVSVDGDVRSNKMIVLDGSASVSGDVEAGGGIDKTGKDAVVKGHQVTDMPNLALPSLKGLGEARVSYCSNSQIQLSSKGRKALEGNSLKIQPDDDFTLNAGEYCVGDFSIAGILRVNGAVKIYVSGNVEIGGKAKINSDGTPGSLIIIAYGEGKTFKIDGNVQVKAAIYAMNPAVAISGSSEIWGSIAAKSVKAGGNSKIHYDANLKDLALEIYGETTESSRQYGD